MILHHALQAWVGLFGAGAILLIASPRPRRQWWGFLLGLLSEPGWILMAWLDGQWAVVLLATWWGVFYARGLRVRNVGKG